MVKADMIRNIADGAELTGARRTDAMQRMARKKKSDVERLYALYRRRALTALACVTLLTYGTKPTGRAHRGLN